MVFFTKIVHPEAGRSCQWFFTKFVPEAGRLLSRHAMGYLLRQPCNSYPCFEVSVLEQGIDTFIALVQVPLWQLLLNAALKHKVDSVIDCGALLAGTETR